MTILLPESPPLPPAVAARLRALHESGAPEAYGDGAPDADPSAPPAIHPSARLARFVLDEFGVDCAARYGEFPLAHPFGKASGQLSLQPAQVRADLAAGLSFVVLKTAIAEDSSGAATMQAWKIREPRMVVERIRGRRVDREGWTVSWAGRGWEGSLESYLAFVREAVALGFAGGMPTIPSCKFHLTSTPGEEFRREEYAHTTAALERAWNDAGGPRPFTLEQDFSPTLAGTDTARQKELVLRWLVETPALVKASARELSLGVKLMNAMFEDEFQVEMTEATCAADGGADFLVCYNRLFDPDRRFGEKKVGIAYGGPDLSERNLWTLREFARRGRPARRLPISATGDIDSGRRMVEYGLAGASSGQLHTFFQLPGEEYALKGVSRSRAALHELFFHPERGFVATMCAVRELLGRAGTLAFGELPALSG